MLVKIAFLVHGEVKRKKFLDQQKDFKISKRVEQLLIGSVLGDGNLKKYKVLSTFRENHCIQQKQYLKWKAQILAKNFIFKIREYHEKKSIKGYSKKLYRGISLYVKANIGLSYYYDLFYRNNKKFVSSEILGKLTPFGLAVWYCDDGSYKYRTKNIELATFVGLI